tara:strand:- start:456 stop:647 length:192 start_codon:yes stop_codon:yes gene_type:complete
MLKRFIRRMDPKRNKTETSFRGRKKFIIIKKFPKKTKPINGYRILGFNLNIFFGSSFELNKSF